MDLEFEWDEDKRASNLSKHGVDFLRVALIFESATVEDVDDREEYDEERIIALVQVDGTVYRVVYTWRGSVIRLISAQKASRHDSKRYYETIVSH
jgi:uncharacterized protein